jgi:hypothetical protein
MLAQPRRARGEDGLDLVVGAGEPGEQCGVLLVEIGERVDGPAVGNVVALAAVAEAEVDVDALELPREVGVPRLAPLGVKVGEDNLVAARGRGRTARRRAGDRIDHAVELEVHLGAEVLLDVRAAGVDGDPAAGLAIALVFVADGIFGVRRARQEPGEQGRQSERAAADRPRGVRREHRGQGAGFSSPGGPRKQKKVTVYSASPRRCNDL